MTYSKKRLGELVDIGSSKRIYAKEYVEQGIPFYRSKELIEKAKGNDVSNKLYISEEKFNELKDKYGAPGYGDLMLTSVGTLGIPYIVRDEEFYFKDGNLTWFKNFRGLDNLYLYYWFKSPYGKEEIKKRQIGSTQKALTISNLKEFEINLPNIGIQRAIANILSAFDDKIENNNAIIANLEEQAQTIFKSWFVDFEPFQDKEFIDSDLGRIPKGWEVTVLEKVADITMGQSPRSEYYNTEGIGHPFMQGNTTFGDKFGTIEKYTSQSNRFSDYKDILLSVRAPVGEMNINIFGGLAIGRGLSSIKPLEKLHGYIYNYLKHYMNRIISKGSGTVFSSINKKDITSFPILLPNDKNKLDYYCEMSETFLNKQITLYKQNKKIEEIRDTLLPKLMSGEIRVGEAAEINRQ